MKLKVAFFLRFNKHSAFKQLEYLASRCPFIMVQALEV